MENIRLIIIEDNKLIREGIRVMLKEHKDIRVVAALGDRINIQDKIEILKPDVLLLDLGLIHQNSHEIVKSLKKRFLKLKIIMMDLLPVQSDMKQFIEAGASGFIFKDANSEEFIDTIRSVAKGDKVFPAQMHGSLFSEIVDNSVNELLDSKLIESIRMTENEKKITGLVSASFTNKDISKMLGLNVSIVKGYIDNILEKLSLSKHLQIAVYRNSAENSFYSSDGKRIKTKIFKRTKQIDFPEIKQIF